MSKPVVSLPWMEAAVLGGGDVRKISHRAGALHQLLQLPPADGFRCSLNKNYHWANTNKLNGFH